MAVNISAEEILRLAMGLLTGGAGGAASAASLLASSGFGKSSASLGEVKDAAEGGTEAASRMRMGATEYPNPQHSVGIGYVGEGIHNSGLNRALADRASRMQSLDEHNAALTKFLRPGQSPQQRAEAIQRGVEEEQKLDSWWYDSKPRKEYSPGSSAIEAVRITPDHRVQVKWRSGNKWYSYLPAKNHYEASLALKDLVTRGSIGRTLMRKAQGMPKDGVGDYGGWARKYFDASYGT